MFILKKGHQPGVYVPLRALFLVFSENIAACDLKVGRCRQLIEIIKVCEY